MKSTAQAEIPGPACFEQLIPSARRNDVHVLPAEQMHLHLTVMPIRSARQRLDALPFALEDHVAQNLEAIHCAICGSGPEGEVLAATIARATLEPALAAHPEKMMVPEQILLPSPAPGPDGEPRWHVYRDGARVLVRSSDMTGFAAQTNMLPVLWEQAGRPAVISLAQPLPKAIPFEDRRDVAVVSEDALRAADLRQGIYQPSRGLIRPLKWLAASVAIAAMGHLAILAMDNAAQKALADDLRTQAGRALVAHLPGASADEAPDLISRRLAARSAPRMGSGFLPVMEQISRALQADASAVQFRELAWTNEALRLTVETPDLDALQKVQFALAAAGLEVSAGSATASDGAARAELTVRP